MGQVFAQANPSQFNTGDPFDKNIPDYYTYQFNGTVSGRISKKASYFVSAERRTIQDDAIVDAFRLAGEVNGDFSNGIYTNSADYSTVSFNDALVAPRTRTNISPRIDLEISPKNTLTARYQYYDNGEQNQGVGQFSLRSQAYRVIPARTLFSSATPRSSATGSSTRRASSSCEIFRARIRPQSRAPGAESRALKPSAAIATKSKPTIPCITSCRTLPKSH